MFPANHLCPVQSSVQDNLWGDVSMFPGTVCVVCSHLHTLLGGCENVSMISTFREITLLTDLLSRLVQTDVSEICYFEITILAVFTRFVSVGLFLGSTNLGTPYFLNNMFHVLQVYGTMKNHMSAIQKLYRGNGLLVKHPKIKELMTVVHAKSAAARWG